MANLSWKTWSLLTITLLVALGLQAGGLKIMINLSHQADESMATRATAGKPRSAAPLTETGQPPASVPEERIAAAPASAPVRPEANPEAALLAEPPRPAAPAVKPESSPSAPSPEARQLPVVTPPPPVAGSTTVANSPPVSAEAGPTPPASNPSPATPVTPAAVPTAPLEANPTPAGGLQEADWISARDPRRYTVQVYSGKDMNALREISVALATTDPQAYFTTTSRSGPWHALVIGDYANSAAAQAAVAKMTARAPMIKPWVRRFDEVQAKLR